MAYGLLDTIPLLPMPNHQRAGHRPSMTIVRPHVPGLISAVLLAIGLLADCAPVPARPTFAESADVSSAIGRAERECGQLTATLDSARASGIHADVPQLYSDLHFHMALVDDALVQVASLSAMALSSGWARLEERDRHAPQGPNRTDPGPERSAASDAMRSAVNALAMSCARLITVARTFKALEARAITVLDEDFSQHGIEAIRPLLIALLADEPQVLRALADLAASATALRNAIIGSDRGRMRSALRTGTSSATSPPPRTAAPGGAT